MEPEKPKPPAQPLLRAVFTDLHFWVPFLVLLAGIAVLAICARA